MAARAPMSGETLRAAGAHLWARNEGKLWSNIDASERVLMAYAKPGICWALSDADALRPPCGLRGHAASCCCGA